MSSLEFQILFSNTEMILFQDCHSEENLLEIAYHIAILEYFNIKK